MHPPGLEDYPDWLKEIHGVYLKAGLWRKWNWYDFLERLSDIMKTYDHK